ncbi:MAG TPA: DHA2 family efflux MFS transporter permease subunit [Steroidobacteraceae bacterium]|nr:DHA2 family efflux MFS transporter permease subunit [Steroidobacteraceae bacterium]
MSDSGHSADRPLIVLPSGTRGLTAVALALATFMQVLDTTIANVSLPTIAGSLGVSPSQGTWVITSFAVSNGVSVPLSGWLMQRYGVVRTFVVCVLLFTIASFLCGVAWSFESLLAFRVLQGAVSGPMIPGSQALLISIFPPSKRGMSLALWSMTTLVAPIVGPVLGGYISDNYTWPWIFLINLPIGVLSASVCWGALHRHESPTRQVPVDRVGLGLLVVWVGALQIMLDTGKDAGWFDSTSIVVLAIVAAIGLCAFLIWELGERHPIVDLSYFRSRNFSVGTTMQCIGYGVFFGNIVLLPLWLQTQLGYTPTWAGLVQAPAGVVALLLSPLAGRNLHRYDPRGFATFAFLMMALSLYMRSLLNSEMAIFNLVVPLLVQGVSMAFFFVSLITVQLDGITSERVPGATSLSNFLRITAGAFATSIATTTWENRADLHQSRLAEAANLNDPALHQLAGAMSNVGVGDQQTLGALTQMLIKEAYTLSSLDYFWISSWVILALIGLIWFARRPHMATLPPAAID